VPALRERADDIPLLAEAFCERISLKGSKSIEAVSPRAMEVLLSYPWPGNVRELQNAMEYAFVLCQGNIIEPEHLPPKVISGRRKFFVPDPGASSPPLSEKEALMEALRKAKGNQSKAAKLLGVSRVTVWKRIKKYGIRITKEFGKDHIATVS
jgi:DNA-binding NtrC family response regulator